MINFLQKAIGYVLIVVIGSALGYAVSVFANPATSAPIHNVSFLTATTTNTQDKAQGDFSSKSGIDASWIKFPFGNLNISTSTTVISKNVVVDGKVFAKSFCDSNGENCGTPSGIDGSGTTDYIASWADQDTLGVSSMKYKPVRVSMSSYPYYYDRPVFYVNTTEPFASSIINNSTYTNYGSVVAVNGTVSADEYCIYNSMANYQSQTKKCMSSQVELPRGVVVAFNMNSGQSCQTVAGADWLEADGRSYSSGGVTKYTVDTRGRKIVGLNRSGTTFNQLLETGGQTSVKLVDANIPFVDYSSSVGNIVAGGSDYSVKSVPDSTGSATKNSYGGGASRTIGKDSASRTNFPTLDYYVVLKYCEKIID